ncbi:6-phosphogluconolactonase [Ornithinimicrobium tianjinense]|uniref:6-phosphogluconolactonase n=1 Tax=Ornithinimicrobium tianjinense TaxID=1195761 RepID=A0A917BM95_9MICO|nr:6-phosphogluconolactonase [Ornithinimicrobium tianjinense]GGF48043.1 6-phosphogluconolactonase [Ornithinimicrobium tianjinense]
MIRDLPTTSTSAVVKELLQLRNEVGAMAMGRVLTLLVSVAEDEADDAIRAANDATRQHPARILVLVSADGRGRGRLDAQIRVGGDAGASEIIVLRLHGALTGQRAAVVTPLLLPDSPIVAWWPGEAPRDVASDPIGMMAHRRITDAAAAARSGVAELRRRSSTYRPGDTDLAWTRITRWRALLASTLESEPFEPVTAATVVAEPDDPSAELLGGWLAHALRTPVSIARGPQDCGLLSVRLERPSGSIDLVRHEDGTDTATLHRVNRMPRLVALHTPTLAESLAEEVRRLDADEVYAAALCEGTPLLTRRRSVREEEPGSRGPRPEVEVRVEDDAVAVAEAVTQQLVERVARAVSDRGQAHVVLTGGSMGQETMRALAARSRAGALSAEVWDHVHLWWGDERFVPAGDDDRNDAQADAAGLGDLPVLKKNIHRVPSGRDESRLAAAAARYAKELAASADSRRGSAATAGGVEVPTFDVVMLGVGPDAHVASLFPGRDELRLTDVSTAAVVDSPKPPPLRVSLTVPALNAARAVWLVVAGAEKAEAVSRSLAAYDDPQLPASWVRGQDETVWWLDRQAAPTG